MENEACEDDKHRNYTKSCQHFITMHLFTLVNYLGYFTLVNLNSRKGQKQVLT